MKKLLFVILALVTVIALASCSNANEKPEEEPDNSVSNGENPGPDDEDGNDPEKPHTDPEKPGNDDNYSEGFAFTLDSKTASYSVTGIGTCTDTDIKIPSAYNGKPVTSIGNCAFEYCSSLTSITIPDSVT